jgi:hypothetical protein
MPRKPLKPWLALEIYHLTERACQKAYELKYLPVDIHVKNTLVSLKVPLNRKKLIWPS